MYTYLSYLLIFLRVVGYLSKDLCHGCRIRIEMNLDSLLCGSQLFCRQFSNMELSIVDNVYALL